VPDCRAFRVSVKGMRVFTVPIALTAFAGLMFAAAPNGTYKGTWTSANEGGGDLTVIFSAGDSNTLKADVSFTLEGETTKCVVKSVTVEGSKLELVMNYEANGNRYEATVSGTFDGKSLSGTYKTKSLADSSAIDSGTWKTNAI
jgi:hypothetical protein